MKSLFLGTQNSPTSTLVAKAMAAYCLGYNSIYTTDNKSWHDNETYFFAQRRTSGRVVANPAGWLEEASARACKRAALMYKSVR